MLSVMLPSRISVVFFRQRVMMPGVFSVVRVSKLGAKKCHSLISKERPPKSLYINQERWCL